MARLVGQERPLVCEASATSARGIQEGAAILPILMATDLALGPCEVVVDYLLLGHFRSWDWNQLLLREELEDAQEEGQGAGPW